MSADKEDIKNVPLVFIPGLFGSHLIRRNGGEKVFLNKRVAFGLKNPDISMPITWEENTKALSGKQQSPCPEICADEDAGCLEYMTILGIKVSGIYGPWLDKARVSGRKVIVFVWDWRRQVEEVSREFESFLQNVVAENGCSAQVVAHSTGGLMSLPLLNKRASELFHSVVFAGCPFGPGAQSYDWLTSGTNIGPNKKLLTPRVLFTHGVLWNFLSFDSDFDIDRSWRVMGSKDQLKGETLTGLYEEGGQIPLPDFNPMKAEDWIKHKLAIFQDGHAATPEEIHHLSNALHTARAFRDVMVSSSAQSKTQSDPVPIVVLRSSHHDTFRYMYRKRSEKNNGSWEWNGVKSPTGDGTVHAINAIPPPGVKYRVVEAPEQIHMTLMETEGFVDGVLNELHQEHLSYNKQSRK